MRTLSKQYLNGSHSTKAIDQMHPEHWVEPTVRVDTHGVLVSALPYLASGVVHISCMYVYGMAGSSAFSLGAGDGASVVEGAICSLLCWPCVH